MCQRFVCRLCAHAGERKVLSLGGYSLRRCENCGFVSLDPLPSDDELGAFYQALYWSQTAQSPSCTSQADSFGVGAMYRLRTGPLVSRLAKWLDPGAHILDVGCGDGAFVRVARERGYIAVGIDKYAPPTRDKAVLPMDLEEAAFEETSFDAVTMHHFLEHVRDPLGTLAEAFRILKPGGLLLVEAPNADALALKLAGSRWQPLEVPSHFNFFTPSTLAKACARVATIQSLAIDEFSLRASPAALVLSVFPGLHPRLVRQRMGRYPLLRALSYLSAQMVFLPAALAFAAIGRGCIFRVFVQKLDSRQDIRD